MPVVHNRGRKIGDKYIARKIIFPEGWDEHGKPLMEGKKPKEKVMIPGAHMPVTDEQLKHLKDNFGEEIVNLSDLQEMQAQFKDTSAPAPAPKVPAVPAGHISQKEADELVARKVQEALAAEHSKGSKKPAAAKPAPVAEAKQETKPEPEAGTGDDAGQKEDAGAQGDGQQGGDDTRVPETRGSFIARIDAMDRAEIIGMIEAEKLPIEHSKLRNPDVLKRSVLKAMEDKGAVIKDAA